MSTLHPVHFVLWILFLFSCSRNSTMVQPPSYTIDGYAFDYQIHQPDTIFRLDYTLNEISGLTYDSINKTLLAINDENGVVFYLNPTTGKIDNKLQFGKPNDYEGISMYRDKIFITQSNGDVKVIHATSGSKLDEFKDKLSIKNDIEGLIYSPNCDCLLLAAKGNSKIKGHKKHNRSIFSMDVITGKVDKEPFMTLSPKKSYKNMIGLNLEGAKKGILEKRMKDFAPSGIAIEPSTGDLFILSSSGHLLLVVDPNGSIKSIQFLDQFQYRQPEGICFDSDGTLYLSSEGKGGTAKLYVISKTPGSKS